MARNGLVFVLSGGLDLLFDSVDVGVGPLIDHAVVEVEIGASV